jgi:hypothetical protein
MEFSEIQVRTDDTRSLRMVTLAPVAAGNTQAWTGVVGNINETTINDANNINDGTGNLKSQWTVGSLPSGTFGIKDVIQSARIANGTSGPQNYRWELRISGADYDNGADILATTTLTNVQKDWATSPATSSAWQQSEIATGFNSGLLSKP